MAGYCGDSASNDRAVSSYGNGGSPYCSLLAGDGGLLLLLGQLDVLLGLLVVVERDHSLLVLGSGLLHGDGLSDLGVADAALALESERGDQSLDLGGLLGLAGVSSDDELSHVVSLGQVEQLSDLVGSLRTQSSGLDLVGQTGDLLSPLLNNDQVHHRQIRSHDATTDGLSLAGALSSGSEALHILVKQESDASVGQNTLHHRETLLVVTATNADNVTGEFLTERVSGDLSCDS